MSGSKPRTSPLSKPDQLKSMNREVVALQKRGFYGRVTLDMAGGNILRLLMAESIELGAPDGEPPGNAQAEGQQAQEAAAEA